MLYPYLSILTEEEQIMWDRSYIQLAELPGNAYKLLDLSIIIGHKLFLHFSKMILPLLFQLITQKYFYR